MGVHMGSYLTMLAVLLVRNFPCSVPWILLSLLEMHHIMLPQMAWQSAQWKPLRVGFKKFQVIWKLNYCPILCITAINDGSLTINAINGLDLVYPDSYAKVTTEIYDTKRSMDKNRLERMFHIGDAVSVVNFQGRPKWLSGILEEQIGSLTFRVRLEDNPPMKKTCKSYSHEYSNRTYREKHWRIQLISEESGTNV